LIHFKGAFRILRPLKHAARNAFADIPNNTRSELPPVKGFDVGRHGALNSLVVAQIEGLHVGWHLDSPQANWAVNNFLNRGPEFNHVVLGIASDVQALSFFFWSIVSDNGTTTTSLLSSGPIKRPSVISPLFFVNKSQQGAPLQLQPTIVHTHDFYFMTYRIMIHHQY
jgi:hypothetical protein